ncbi:hypothetical protein [Thiolapillus sp.]|uniref:hypothetical protein n=1 Tax=Thiolapillus sp. TaxID=2017437 RepID=UPI003AF58A40
MLPDKDEGRDVCDASISMPVSSSKDPKRLKVLIGSSWPFAFLSPFPFFFKVLVAFAEGRDAAGFLNSAVCTHAPATFTFPAMAVRLGAEDPDLARSVGTRG